MRDCDVILLKGKSLFAKVIKPWTYSQYSHAGLILTAQIGGIESRCVIEALEPNGVRMYPLWRYLNDCRKDNIGIDLFPVNVPLDHDAVARFAFSTLGARYVTPWQFVESFGNIYRWVKGKLGGNTERNLNPDRFFCSEWVMDALEAGGLTLTRPAYRTAPGFISGLPCFREKEALV